ncbi:MAG TPA: orotidine-5'-phosphate decarboxylase [Acidimicrobiia bacterium]
MSDVTSHLALGLDFDDPDYALGRAAALREWFGVAKVGYELYGAAGPSILVALRELGYSVFLDVKLHDIPHTVERGAYVLARYGVGYLNVHACGGVDMMRAAVTGANEGASAAGVAPPTLLGVTVLTSDSDTRAFSPRLQAAIDAGLGGVVCSAHEATEVKRAAPTFVTMVPGIRLAGSSRDDQSRVATPGEAIRMGSDIVIAVRTVHNAPDPLAAAQQVYDEVEAALHR